MIQKVRETGKSVSFESPATRRHCVVACSWKSTRSTDFLTIGNGCKKVEVEPADWQEVEQAVNARDLFDSPELPQLTHSVCDL
jgi:hypothetical protein